MNNIDLSIISVVLLSILTIIASWRDHNRANFFIIVLSIVIGIISIYLLEKEKVNREILSFERNSLRVQLDSIQKESTLIKRMTSNLTTLNKLSGNSKYYVRIATHKSKKSAQADSVKIVDKFIGAAKDHVVKVKRKNKDSYEYELIFGYDLDVTEAEIFLRLANSHRFPGSYDNGLPKYAEIIRIRK